MRSGQTRWRTARPRVWPERIVEGSGPSKRSCQPGRSSAGCGFGAGRPAGGVHRLMHTAQRSQPVGVAVVPAGEQLVLVVRLRAPAVVTADAHLAVVKPQYDLRPRRQLVVVARADREVLGREM